ncbi:MAG: TonB-dependent receptor [Acidobacteriota bacterium]|nr:MAG: TonB-dependent receptor [Acidobacteriota bacterium]
MTTSLFSGRILAIALLLVFPGLVAAQGTTGTISGTVSDDQGSMVPGATITVTHLETGAVRTVTSGERGEYSVPGLALGNYVVRVELTGFETSVREGIELSLGRHAVVDTVLSVGAVTEQVVVIADARAVDTTGSTLGGLVDDVKIRDLPLNVRSFLQLTTLEPGVLEFRNVGEPTSTFPGSGRGLRIAVNGVRPEMNNYMIDGVDVGDAYNNSPGGASGLFLGVESLREFQVLTSTYTVEYGRVGGGIINAATRSGGSAFHGWGFEFHRNDSMNAKNFFDAEGSKPDFTRNQFGFGVSGPIVKDKTFFLVSYEGLREDLGRTIVSVVPDDNARMGIIPDPMNPGGTISVPVSPAIQPYLDLYPRANRDPNPGDGVAEHAFIFQQPTDEDFLTLRLDHQFSESNSMYARYIIDAASVDRPISFPQFAVVEESTNQFFVVEQQSVLSENLLNQFRFGFSRTRFQSLDTELTRIDPSLAFIDGNDFGTLIVGGLSNMGITTFGPTNTPTQNLFSFYDSASYFLGRHSLKFGGNFQSFNIKETNSLVDNGLWNFFSLGNFLQNRPFAFLGTQTDSDLTREYRQSLLGLFIEDDFRVASNFVLNLGLRWERNSVPTEADGKLANLVDPFNDAQTTVGDPIVDSSNLNNFSPRIGFNWDLRGDGKTSLRGGAGLYYHQVGYSYFFRSMMYSPPNTGFGALPGFLPFVKFPRIPTRFFPANIVFPTQFDLETPRITQFNVNLQHEIIPSGVLTVGYVGSRGKFLGRVTEINTFRFTEVNGEKFFTPGPRVNPNWVGINLIDTQGSSTYDSLQIGFNKRFSQGYQFQASYTYGVCEDNAPPLLRDVESSSNIVMDALDLDSDRGPCNSDIRHNLVFNYSWHLPFGKDSDGVAKALLDGWQVTGITLLQSGTPFTVENGFDRARTGKLGPFLTDRPNVASGADDNPILGGPEQYFDPLAFELQPAGFYGNLGRNTLRGPSLNNWDVSFIKNNRLGDGGVNLQLRFEFFNIFNSTNFSVPTGPGRLAFLGAAPGPGAPGTRNPVAGRIFRTVTPARQFQFGIKVLF